MKAEHVCAEAATAAANASRDVFIVFQLVDGPILGTKVAIQYNASRL